MRFLVAAILLGLVTCIDARLAPLFEHEDKIDGEYIVVLKYDGDLDGVLTATSNDVRIHVERRFRYAFKGFQAHISEAAALREIRERADVSFVEEDSIIRPLVSAVTWGQDRVDQRNLPLDGNADFAGTGQGVNAYIIDTGIYPDNTYFDGRASVFYDAITGGDGIDCNGHGTHCAGTIGSYRYGIAREANLFGVRVLSCIGFGTTSNIIKGMDYVAQNHVKPAVASMSLGGGSSTVLDNAVKGLVKKGVTVVVAAGAACILLGENPNLTPRQVAMTLDSLATSDTIQDVGEGSPNKLLYIGADGDMQLTIN